MTDLVYSFAAGISDDWIAQNPVLALGQPAWEVDTLKGKVGDGSTAYNDLAYSIGDIYNGEIPQIDDSVATSGNVWSALQTQTYGISVLQQANAYTDQAVQGSTRPLNMVAIYQNADGTWPNRPSADTVVAYGYPGLSNSPSWMVALVDDYKVR